MSDDPPRPVHLEDDDEASRKPRPRPAPAPGPGPGEGSSGLELEAPEAREAPARAPSTPRPAPRVGPDSVSVRPRGGASEDEVDTRTVAEKRGQAVPVVAGRRPPPIGWPEEAFTFPLRRPGALVIAGGALAWTLLDLATHVNLFLGLILKLPALLFFLRWQLHVASMSAAGWDRPAGWSSSLEVGREQIRGIAVLVGAGVLLAGVTWALLRWSTPLVGTVAFAVGSLWLAAAGLGQAVGDPALIRPWRALAWIVRHPIGLLTGTLGWWAFGGTEIAVAALHDESWGLIAFVALALRLGVMYLWLLSARALGVVGRSWSAWAEDEEPRTQD